MLVMFNKQLKATFLPAYLFDWEFIDFEIKLTCEVG